MLRKEQIQGKHGSQMSDDEPLYDSVASDDDYAALASTDSPSTQAELDLENEVKATLLSTDEYHKECFFGSVTFFCSVVQRILQYKMMNTESRVLRQFFFLINDKLVNPK